MAHQLMTFTRPMQAMEPAGPNRLNGANITASASFSLIINDGSDHVVDSKTISGFTSYNESSFTARSSLDLSAFAGKTVTLKLVVTASDSSSTVTSATAVVDQIQIQ